MWRDGIGFLRKYLHAAGACAYLFTAGVFRARDRVMIGRLSARFGGGRSLPIPAMDASELVPPGQPAQVREPLETNGNISLFELTILGGLVAARRPKALFEIGTFDGRTTLNLAANAPAEARVYTLDLPREAKNTRFRLAPVEGAFADKAEPGSRYRGTDLEARITGLLGDSGTFDFGPYRNAMDFVFVDGSHAFEYVLHDSRTAVELLRGGRGLVAWHDYGPTGWDGVTRALNRLHAGGGAFAGLRRVRDTSLVVLDRR